MKKRNCFLPVLMGTLALVLLSACLLNAVPTKAEAATASELKQQLEELEKEKDKIDAQLAELEGKLSDNLNEMEKIIAQKDVIDQEIFTLYQKTVNINEQIAAYSALIADKQEELDEAQTHLDELNEKNKERIRAMEEDGAISYWSVLFEANSFSDFLDRLNMVEEIAASDQRRLNEMSKAAEAVAAAKTELEEGQAALQVTKAELEASQATMEEKRKEADVLLAELIATGEEYQAYIDAKELEENELSIKIDDTEQLYENQKYQEWLATSVATKPSYSGGTAGEGTTIGGLTWLKPTTYSRVSSPYGWRIHPVYGDWRFHNGIDLSASSGTPIVATRSGKVVVAQYSSSAGYYVTVDHQDGFQSKYLHMTHYIVGVGDYVTAGQVIGYVGSTGVSTGAHLHFTITYNGNYVNPADYIKF
ncbi:MAG: peptidoglycan DD-metalloendopeptidase family protein [Oscillospiraceae bacterium]|nr:peptidoglycan DD-metalloendopeptidase family protein [Oscillospiraceae bacterium]MBQ8797837.1 peptidoglycan DD-metalloendopeptidase family protein [Oscillospiraceae bacterium]